MEKRERGNRLKIEIPVLVEISKEHWRRLKTGNLSEGGMFIEGLFSPPGTIFDFVLLSSHAIFGTARTCWVGNRGSGCKFTFTDTSIDKLLQELGKEKLC